MWVASTCTWDLFLEFFGCEKTKETIKGPYVEGENMGQLWILAPGWMGWMAGKERTTRDEYSGRA